MHTSGSGPFGSRQGLSKQPLARGQRAHVRSLLFQRAVSPAPSVTPCSSWRQRMSGAWKASSFSIRSRRYLDGRSNAATMGRRVAQSEEARHSEEVCLRTQYASTKIV